MILLTIDHSNTFKLLQIKDDQLKIISYKMEWYNLESVYEFYKPIILDYYDKDLNIELMEKIISLVSLKYQTEEEVIKRNKELFIEAYNYICDQYAIYPSYDITEDL